MKGILMITLRFMDQEYGKRIMEYFEALLSMVSLEMGKLNMRMDQVSKGQ